MDKLKKVATPNYSSNKCPNCKNYLDYYWNLTTNYLNVNCTKCNFGDTPWTYKLVRG